MDGVKQSKQASKRCFTSPPVATIGKKREFRDADLSNILLIIMELHYSVTGEQKTYEMVRKLVIDGFSVNLEASGGGVAVFRRH